MNEHISIWILEYLLRQKLDERIINGVLESLTIKDGGNYRLKKTILLRKIEYEALNASISEKLLDWLEIVEELDHREGKLASNSMKKAYCDVAVDCTVRFLDDNVENNAKYVEAVKRVWRERVCKIESLVSEESKRRLGEIEAAVCDSDGHGELMRINTRIVALKSVRVYLAEAWESLGKTFLELVAEKAGNTLEEVCAGSGSSPVGPVADPCGESPINGETPKAQAPVRRKHIAVKSRRFKGAKISDANEGNEDKVVGNTNDNPSPEVKNNEDKVLGNTNDNPSPEVKKNEHKLTANTDDIPSPIQLSSMQPHATKKVNTPSASQTTQTLETDNMNSETNLENQGNLATPNVNRIQEALKSSLEELRAVVKDPLPDALRIAETRSSTLPTNNSSSGCEPVAVKEREPKTHVPRENTENGVENVDEIKLRRSKHSLMESNGTAHTYEWDDSIGSPGDSSKRPRLQSPNETKPPSPLKSYELIKFSRKRARKKWTPLEEETLRSGVQKYGRGSWKLIWHSYREIFSDRTEVDLKDKWRNMTK